MIQKREERDDPLVPFERIRLVAAMRDYPMFEKELARRVGVSQQRANYVAKKAKKCRRSLLEEIAEVLEVPVDWLTGKEDALFLQPFPRRGQWAGSEWDQPGTAYELLVKVRFAAQCRRAFQRDLRLCGSEEERERRTKLQGAFLYAIYDLLSVGTWWKAVFEREPDFEYGAGDYWDIIAIDDHDLPPTDEMDARTTAAIVRALDILLKPWFEGVAQLDYEKVIQLADYLKELTPKPRTPRRHRRPNRN